MKYSFGTFIWTNVILTVIFSVFHFYYFQSVTTYASPFAAHFLYVFLFGINILAFRATMRSMKKKPQAFLNTFMLSTTARMLLSLIALVPFILYFGGAGKFTGVFFLAAYFIFLIVEVTFLSKISKQIK